MARINLRTGILLMLLCTLFTAAGQLFLKKGVDLLAFDILSILTNLPLVAGISFYGLGALILIFALKHGELNVLYPIVSLTFVWVTILSHFFLGEQATFPKLFGTATILIGVFFITKGGKK